MFADDIAEPVWPLDPTCITITRKFGSITLSLDPKHDYTMSDVVGAFIRPALLAVGFSENVVNDYVVEVY